MPSPTGINVAPVNLGIGVGEVIGDFYADLGDASTFTAIFLADVACMLAPIAMLLGHRRTRVLVVMTVLWAFGVLTFNAVFALGEPVVTD